MLHPIISLELTDLKPSWSFSQTYSIPAKKREEEMSLRTVVSMRAMGVGRFSVPRGELRSCYVWLSKLDYPCAATADLFAKKEGLVSRNEQMNLTVCWILEEDSYYSSYARSAAAVDLAITHSNRFILPENVQLQLVFQNAGSSCSDKQYSVISNVLKTMRSGVDCNVFLGVGCPSTAVALYGIAENLNIPILGCPASGTPALMLRPTAFSSNLPLLLQISFGSADIKHFCFSFLHQHNYSHVAILRDDAYTFYSLMSKFFTLPVKPEDNDLAMVLQEFPFASDKADNVTYRQLLLDASNVARVILIFGHAVAVRKTMIAAHSLGFTKGDYVFMALELFPLIYWGNIKYNDVDQFNDEARQAFQSLLIMSIRKQPVDIDTDSFANKVKYLAREKYNYTFRPLEDMDPTITAHYEAVTIYAQEIAKMVASGFYSDFHGNVVTDRIKESSEYEGVSGTLRIGEDGERDIDMELRVFNWEAGKFQVAVEWLQKNFTESFRDQNSIVWPSSSGLMPADEPPCGYRNDKCVESRIPTGVLAAAIVIPILVLFALIGGGGTVLLKFRKMRQDFDPNWWRIKTSDDLVIKMNRLAGDVRGSRKTLNSRSTAGTSGLSEYSAYKCDILATYKGTLVMLTEVEGMQKTPTPEMIHRFTVLKSITSTNLHKFIGMGMSDRGICEYIIYEVCSKGSMTDILHNEMIKLDWSFKNSLIKDIVFGMTYLHGTPILSHGFLNSHTCLVDNRFSLKISDFGLPFFREPAELQPPKPSDKERSYELLLWRAPELLRQVMPPEGTQKGDVYSFAILIQQIILRSGPFELPNDPLELPEEEILREVIASNIPPVRPRVPRSLCSNELYDLMERCWEEIPIERPTFPKIKDRLKRVIGDVGDNIVDLLFSRMEQYALDLEQKVAEKTQQFMDEKVRSELLLSQLLPKPVAAALTRGERVDPETFDSVTIYFSDIVGFTTLAASGAPMDVVSLLNGLYTFFDSILEKYDVYKVETIGDAYMVSSGLPIRNGNRHAAEIAHMSIQLIKEIRLFDVPNKPNAKIEIRVGVNSGSCVAGIVGMKMPRYCLFGDTVNVASRMESTGEPMKIQISNETKELLQSIGGFMTIERGPVAIKGKGTMITYWLLETEL